MVVRKPGRRTHDRDARFSLRRIVHLEIVLPKFLKNKAPFLFTDSCPVVDDPGNRRRRKSQFLPDADDAPFSAFSCHSRES